VMTWSMAKDVSSIHALHTRPSKVNKRMAPSQPSPRSPVGQSVTFLMVVPSRMAWQKHMYCHHHTVVLL
jgi:hypothetical protein